MKGESFAAVVAVADTLNVTTHHLLETMRRHPGPERPLHAVAPERDTDHQPPVQHETATASNLLVN